MFEWFRRGVPVQAHALHGRQVRYRNGIEKKLSLFPFFDERGEVEVLLIVDVDEKEAGLLEADDVDLQVPFFAPIELDVTPLAPEELSNESVTWLHGLWHFDPWWLFSDPAYAGRRWVRTVKGTNLAAEPGTRSTGGTETPHLMGLFFDRKLTKVQSVYYMENRTYRNVAFAQSPWADRRSPIPEGSSFRSFEGRTEWVLDPFWKTD